MKICYVLKMLEGKKYNNNDEMKEKKTQCTPIFRHEWEGTAECWDKDV